MSIIDDYASIAQGIKNLKGEDEPGIQPVEVPSTVAGTFVWGPPQVYYYLDEKGRIQAKLIDESTMAEPVAQDPNVASWGPVGQWNDDHTCYIVMWD